MRVLQRAGTAAPPSPATRLERWLRRARRFGVVALVVFAAIGTMATWNVLAGAPGVGHFRSAEGRAEYAAAYREAMGQLPEPTAVHDVRTDHGTVRVYEWATEQDRDRAPVLLVPGRASGVPMWAENLSGLAEERRVLAFDALGDSGMSVQSAPFETFADQAGPVDDVVQQLAPGGVHLVGHSFGGAMAATYAHHHPDRTITLTLLDPVLTFGTIPPAMFLWATVLSLPGVPDGLRDRALERVGGVSMDHTELREDTMGRMVAAASEHYSAALPTPAQLSDEQLQRMDMPVYVALAERDSLAGDGAAERAGELPRSIVRTWRGTTHSLPMQAAGELESVLLEFFRDHDPG